MDALPQNGSTDRQPIVAGKFYPADRNTLTRDLSDLFSACEKPESGKTVRAIITPHAGYVFSGKTAAVAYSAIPPNAHYNNIFIIGSSHVMSYDGASVYDSGDFVTPLGKLSVNKEIASKLKRENSVFNFPVAAHLQEHSIEVQLPFIQYRFKETPLIVPIVIGTHNEHTIRQIAEAIRPWFTPENLFIISSDFSHYPPYDRAIEVDRLTAEALAGGKPEIFLEALKKNSLKRVKGLATSMCGWTSGLALLYLSEKNSTLEFNLLDYTNSGDSRFGSKDEVVGYHAISLTEKNISSGEFSFTEDEIKQMFAIARNSILSKFGNAELMEVGSLSSKLSERMGAFVTLKINGNLRGCIGRFISEEPLSEVVKESAFSSAFGDPRFLPLTKDEYRETDFEITVLGPLKRIKNIDEIVLGRHGIYIKKDSKSGTMLPQVAVENGWDLEQFLGYTAREKAGIGWHGWKDAELYIYEGIVLAENGR